MIKERGKEALTLWVATGVETDANSIIAKLSYCNRAIDLFLDGQLPIDVFLDSIEAQGVDMDDYAETTANNLNLFGLV
ncbi:MAG: hypothetical protein QNJ64_08450 [Crocosphaera sp.]|nr:hypothetical protein [Crocosphaera sp.]